MSENLHSSDISNSLNSPRRKAAEKAEEAIRNQMHSESESESDTDTNINTNTECTPKPNDESSCSKVTKKTETIQEQLSLDSVSNEKSELKSTLKPSASTSSFGSQRSVPRRRAAYKAAARIRKIAQQELPASDSEKETVTPTQPPSCVQRRQKKKCHIYEIQKPVANEEDLTILSMIKTLLLLSLFLVGCGQMLTFFLCQCQC